MKLSRIREIANSYEEVVLAEREANINYNQNPSTTTQKAYMNARRKLAACKKTLKNYSPVFNVTLGDFAHEIEAVLKNNGAENIELMSTSLTETAAGEFKTELFLSFTMNDNDYSYNLGKIIKKDPASLQEIENMKVNLFSMGMVKGKNMARLSEIQSVLDHAGWACITNTIKKDIYLAQAAKEERNRFKA